MPLDLSLLMSRTYVRTHPLFNDPTCYVAGWTWGRYGYVESFVAIAADGSWLEIVADTAGRELYCGAPFDAIPAHVTPRPIARSN